MSRYLSWFVSWFLLCGVGLFFTPAGSAQTQKQSFTIATGELPPYTAALSAHDGYINHIITVAFEQVDIDVKFEYLPWARAYKDAQDGIYPMSSYWYRDVKHNQNFYHSDTLISDRVVFFRKKSPLAIDSFNGIKQHRLRLGLTRGYTYTEEIWQWARENARLVSVVNTDLQNLQMLILGRIDIVPVDEISGWYALHKNFSSEQVQTIETLSQNLLSQEATVLFSKAHPDANRLLTQFNKGLKLARDKGILEEMQLKFVSGFYSEKGQD